ncbi:MAG: winged helix-turn-helix domain-containing protein [Alphaproteobacteria bacterium]|nr:winged helix-turn-helix domain-containing protein [Alphaproteobacteria bacterium]
MIEDLPPLNLGAKSPAPVERQHVSVQVTGPWCDFCQGKVHNGRRQILDVRFRPFRLLSAERRLEKGGKPVRLGGRALDLLTVLVERAGEVVSNRDILDSVWRGVTVDESSLRFHVKNCSRTINATRLTLRTYLVAVTVRNMIQLIADPFVQTGVLAVVGAVITRLALRRYSARHLIFQLIFFLALTALLDYHGIVPDAALAIAGKSSSQYGAKRSQRHPRGGARLRSRN